MAVVEDWTGTTGNAWNASKWEGLVSTGGSTATIQTNAGQMVATFSYNAVSQRWIMADTANQDWTVTMTPGSTTQETYPGIYIRAAATYGGNGGDATIPTTGYGFIFTVGSNIIEIWSYTALGRTLVTSGTYTFTTSPTKLRFQAIGTTIQAKLWVPPASEPGTWDLTGTDSTYTTGRMAINVYGGNAGNSTITFDDLTDNLGASAPAQATSLVATPLSATTVGLTWTNGVDGGSAITDTLIEVAPDVSGSPGTYAAFTHTALGTTPSITVTGKSQGTKYWFRVSNINAIGTGTASTATNATTWDVPVAPSAPVAVANYSKVDLTWVAPANGGSAITGYVVEFNDGTTWRSAPDNHAWQPTAALTTQVGGASLVDYGMQFSINESGHSLIGLRIWSPSGVTIPNRTWAFRDTTSGTVLRSGSLPPTLPYGWSNYWMPTPYTLVSGTTYTLTYVSNTDLDLGKVTTVLPVTYGHHSLLLGAKSSTLGSNPTTTSSTFYGVDPLLDSGSNTPIAVAGLAYTVLGLPIGASFTFRVSAVNAVGTSTASSASSSVTVLDPMFTLVLEDGTSPFVLEDGTSPLISEG